MKTTQEAAPSPPLAIPQTIQAAWHRIRETHRELAIAVCVPLSIQVPLVIISALVYDGDFLRTEVWGLLLLEGLVSVLIAVRCHQLFLTNEANASVSWIPRWTLNDTWFALTSIVIIAAFGVTMMATMPLLAVRYLGTASELSPGIQSILSYVVMFPAFYVLARLVLALPVAAVEGRIDFAAAWRLSKGNGWALAILAA
jgi:hypothetical protein